MGPWQRTCGARGDGPAGRGCATRHTGRWPRTPGERAPSVAGVWITSGRLASYSAATWLEMVVLSEEDTDLRPAGLLLGRGLNLLLGLVVAEGDADRPEMAVMVEEDADLRPAGLLLGREQDLLLGAVVAEGDANRPEMVVVVD